MGNKISFKDHNDPKFSIRADRAIKCLSKKRDCKINFEENTIYVDNSRGDANHDIGNKSWGHIDFLVKHAGMKLVHFKANSSRSDYGAIAKILEERKNRKEKDGMASYSKAKRKQKRNSKPANNV